ncbi:chromatin binding protein [Rhizina undulata]
MNLSLLDPFTLAQDYPESLSTELRSGHSTCVRFNRKGDLIASGRLDGTVVLFDVETNGLARFLRGHVRQIQSLSWSQDGRYLISCSQDFKVIKWDLSKTGEEASRPIRFNSPVYCAEIHPQNPNLFVSAIYEDIPYLVDISGSKAIKYPLPTAPKRPLQPGAEEGEIDEKRAAQDAKQLTTASVFTVSGAHVITGTNKGWLNVISTKTREIIYSTRLTNGCITYIRLTASGRNMVVNANDRILRSIQIPDNLKEGVDGADLHIEVEHKFQDVVNRLLWNHCTFSGNGDYVIASTFKNHDIYIWERSRGSLVKILEGPKEELGVVEWHPTRPVVAATGLESGKIFIWATSNPQRWSALAPDFRELEENIEYEEREDEFDIHPKEDVTKRRLHLENEEVDVVTIEPVRGEVEGWTIPVILDLEDTESEEETPGPVEKRKKSPVNEKAPKASKAKKRKAES